MWWRIHPWTGGRHDRAARVDLHVRLRPCASGDGRLAGQTLRPDSRRRGRGAGRRRALGTDGGRVMTEIIREIGPEDLAALPYRLRCLTPGCWLDRDPSTAAVAESLNSVGELHVTTTKHRVVIERIGSEPC